ncbi:MAG: hypothetical protein IT457_14250 [Planctomycetes bacterium]|nr:hypothetical protein [Planctomycetota bacterium]
MAACRVGEVAGIDESLPTEKSDTNQVRAAVLRFFALGGDADHPVHEHGVRLQGAWIDEPLDLGDALVPLPIVLRDCHIAAPIDLNDSCCARTLSFEGSRLAGLSAARARIGGSLSICMSESSAGMKLPLAQIRGDLEATGAKLGAADDGAALDLGGAQIGGSAYLDSPPNERRFEVRGLVRLMASRIGGDLDCKGSSFQQCGQGALLCDRAKIGGNVFLQPDSQRRPFMAKGGVRFAGAHIGGQLNCQGADLQGDDDAALHCDGAQIGGSVFLGAAKQVRQFTAVGGVRLCGARIMGQANCCAGRFSAGRNGDALCFDGAQIGGDVILNSGHDLGQFEANGRVALAGAHISGRLECLGARFEVDSGVALCFDNAEISKDVILGSSARSGQFNALGEVRFLQARIGGSLTCVGARLQGKGGKALSCDGSAIGGSIHLSLCGDDASRGFEAVGEVRLLGVRIGGQLNCEGARFKAATQDRSGAWSALSLEAARVAQNVFLRAAQEAPLEATGTINLSFAELGMGLCIEGARMESPDGIALKAHGMRVRGTFVCRPASPLNGADLGQSRVGALDDDVESAWGGNLVLDGFHYEALGGTASSDAGERVKWLMKQKSEHCGRSPTGDDFRPQPWQQLQKVMRAAGHFEAAHEVAIAMERHLSKVGRIGATAPGTNQLVGKIHRWVTRGLHRGFGLFAGYGHRPMRLLAWLLAFWLGCALFYWVGAVHYGAFGPSSPLVFQHEAYLAPSAVEGSIEVPGSGAAAAHAPWAGNWYDNPRLPEEYTAFSPLAYSLDLLLPLVDLQQERDWAPLIPTPRKGLMEEFLRWEFKHVIRLVMWFETLFGWVFSLLFVATVSGLAKRREE